MAFSSTSHLPRIEAEAARRLVLSLFPRCLRTCLDTALRIPAARQTLVLDTVALVPEAAPLARAWNSSADADPLLGDPSPIPARLALVQFLDHHAAAWDRPAARTLADVVTLLSCTVDDAEAGARLALPLWLECETLPDLVLQMPAIAEAQTEIGLGPVHGPEVDDDFVPRSEARQMLLEAWNEALGEALAILKGSASGAVAAAAVLSRGGTCAFMTGGLLVPGLCRFGARLTQSVADSAELAERRRRRAAETALKRSEGSLRELKAAATASPRHPGPLAETTPRSVPEGHILVVSEVKDNGLDRTKSVTRGYEGVIGRPIPLAPVPDLVGLRAALAFEFPHAINTIDRLLVDLVGRRDIGFRPTLLVGPPGTGKSRFAARLAHHLAVGLWRIDATRDSGACIGGTDRRWATAEPAHPILAITRFGIANPLLLVDELEKAATRSDHGRLWDSILPLLESETAKSYPDPAFQTEVDLSHISWIATANSVDPLPGPLRDRLRVLAMPAPQIPHLESLIAPVLAGIAESRGLDPRLLATLDGEEIDVVRRGWRGGSIRRLSRLVEAVVIAREALTQRH